MPCIIVRIDAAMRRWSRGFHYGFGGLPTRGANGQGLQSGATF
jgi:hypothetical protein